MFLSSMPTDGICVPPSAFIESLPISSRGSAGPSTRIWIATATRSTCRTEKLPSFLGLRIRWNATAPTWSPGVASSGTWRWNRRLREELPSRRRAFFFGRIQREVSSRGSVRFA